MFRRGSLVRLTGSPSLVSVGSRRAFADNLPYDDPLPRDFPHGKVLRYQHRARTRIYDPDDKPWNRGITVAVIGASGNIGRQIVMSISAQRKNFASIGSFTLQLVGRRDMGQVAGRSMSMLVGLCTELRDAYDNYGPHLEIVADLEAVRADIIIFAAGANLTSKYKTSDEVAHANSEICEQHARALIDHNKDSLVLLVSQPAEAGVDTFIESGFQPNRVFGTGALIDTLRFRREIASELHVPRQHVSGLVLGMHGLGMVPCWSTVNLSPVISNAEKRDKLEKLKEDGLARMPMNIERIKELAYEVRDKTMAGDALLAGSMVSEEPADIRAMLRRYVSFFSGPIYPRIGIGEKVASIIDSILNGRSIVSAAQLRLDGEFLGLKGHAIGAPAIICGEGVQVNQAVRLHPREEEAVKNAYVVAGDLAQALTLIRRSRQKRATKAAAAEKK